MIYAHPIPFQKGLKYYKTQLSIDNVLSHYLLKEFHFEEGNFYSLISSNHIDKSHLLNLDQGRIQTNHDLETETIKDKLAAVIQTLNLLHPSLCCVFEDVMHKKEDHFDASLKKNVFLNGEELYFIPDRTSIKKEILDTDAL